MVLEGEHIDRGGVSTRRVFVSVVAVADLEIDRASKRVLVENFTGIVNPHAEVDLVEEERRKVRNGVAEVGASPSVLLKNFLAPLDKSDGSDTRASEVEHFDWSAVVAKSEMDLRISKLRLCGTHAVPCDPDLGCRVLAGEFEQSGLKSGHHVLRGPE